MKKFFIIALAIIFVAPFVADMASAGDLSVSGTMRVRAWNIDDGNVTKEYWDQRLRTAFTFSAAEGISAHLRMDFNENVWGNQDWSGSRSVGNNELQVDRAYLQVAQEGYKLKAGQLYAGLGSISAYDNNQYGILADITAGMPLTLTLGFIKNDEDQTSLGTDLTDEDGFEDNDHYLANVAFASGAYSLNVFAVMQKDDTSLDDTPTLFGIQGKTTIGGVALLAELDSFSGDSASTDYIGTQLYVNAEMKFSDALSGGLDFVYAQGTDDTSETQLTQLGDNFSDWTLMDRGPFQADITDFDDMDPSGNSGGSMGGGVYVDFSATEAVLIQASIFSYSMPDDGNDPADITDSVLGYNLGVNWKFAPNTTLAGQYNSYDFDDDVDSDAVTTLVARLQIKF